MFIFVFLLNFDTDLEKAVMDFGEAFAKADVEQCQSMLHPDYMHVNGSSGSVIGATKWLAWLETRRKDLENGKYVLDSYEVRDLQFQVFGDVAYVTGVVASSGKDAKGSFQSTLRFSNVWVKYEGRWLRAAFHDSAVNP